MREIHSTDMGLFTQGGHFAAMEKPQELMEDMEEFIGKIGWPVK